MLEIYEDLSEWSGSRNEASPLWSQFGLTRNERKCREDLRSDQEVSGVAQAVFDSIRPVLGLPKVGSQGGVRCGLAPSLFIGLSSLLDCQRLKVRVE